MNGLRDALKSTISLLPGARSHTVTLDLTSGEYVADKPDEFGADQDGESYEGGIEPGEIIHAQFLRITFEQDLVDSSTSACVVRIAEFWILDSGQCIAHAVASDLWPLVAPVEAWSRN